MYSWVSFCCSLVLFVLFDGCSGIWVENGGGGSVADVEVIGGKQGIFIGGQQVS